MAQEWRYCSNHADLCEVRGKDGFQRARFFPTLEMGFAGCDIHRNALDFLCKALQSLLACGRQKPTSCVFCKH